MSLRPGTLLSRYLYYLSSVPALAGGFRLRPADWVRLAGGIARDPVTVEIPAAGLRMLVRSLMDLWVLKEVCLDREYRCAADDLPAGAVVLDIGAGLGEFCIDLARRHPLVPIHAFEPYPPSFDLLRRNISANGAANVTAHPDALGAATQTGTLSADPGSPHLASTAAGNSREPPRPQRVRVRSLEDVLRTISGGPVVMKLDCEGAEYGILLAAPPAVFARIAVIVLEYHEVPGGYGRRDLVDFLAGLGFEVEVRANRAHDHLGLICARKPAPSRADGTG